jgi:hypothetical protein
MKVQELPGKILVSFRLKIRFRAKRLLMYDFKICQLDLNIYSFVLFCLA